ncbi:MAG TPA: tryptophan synthase subunit alpha [Pyrinomonadaceae bacterium]|nr:tryptophan synthase subunit alpha [Pyrinomonadaceae bacterium]
MGRIDEAFNELRRDGKKGFIPFITAGDPDLAATADILIQLSQAGATVIELGVPFSDPMADGPVIQRASERALKHGPGVADILKVVATVRREIETPIILFSYYNPLLQFGLKRLAEEARGAGVDGVLVTDLSPEEAGEFDTALRANELDMIFLVAPTSTDERLKLVAERARGFIYAVSRAGVTGVRTSISAEAEKLVNRMRNFSSLPIAVGFGISNVEQVKDVQRYADAVVVGSAIVAEMERLEGEPDVAKKIGEFTRSLNPYYSCANSTERV